MGGQDPIAEFRNSFCLDTWFDRWCRDLAAPTSAGARWPPTVRRMVLEALSDSSPEQFLNPLVAMHLRRFGAKIASEHAADRVFWVRSEWEKVDLSYGLARPFKPSPREWNCAWERGDTGDVGQCEVKVCYAHHCAGKMKILAGQLLNRRERDKERQAPGFEQLRYHGLVWLFQHGGVDEMQDVSGRLEKEAQALGLDVVRSFEMPGQADELGRLWPSEDGSDYRCGMAMMLLELSRWAGFRS